MIGQSGIRLKGRIDRLDVKPDRRGVRMSDYKTGTTPRNVRDVILGGGGGDSALALRHHDQTAYPGGEHHHLPARIPRHHGACGNS